MRKKIWCGCILLCTMLLLSVDMLTVHAEEITAAKKIISVVYDDSGSMLTESNWSSANYAMQAFASLLNEQDEMYITYMSDVGTAEEGAVKIDLTDVEGAVQQIRNDVDSFGGTPMKAVDIAMDKLKSIQETDPATQFWLVVLTDGSMDESETNYSDLQSMLDDYAGSAMSNGSGLYVNYMGIGSLATDIQADASKGLDSVQAGTNIVPVLSDIANKISGRMKFEGDTISQTGGNTITVHSDIPLYTIAVFSQSSNAIVEKAEAETALTVKRNVTLKYPEVEGKSTNTSLFGNAALVTNGDKVIPTGDYTLTFSEEVSLENLVVMYQPAIKMEAKVTRGGVAVDDLDSLAVDDTIDIELIPVNPETGEEIAEGKLPKGIQWSIEYQAEDQTKGKADSRALSGMKVEQGKNSIVCTMQIPDYVPNRQVISFTPSVPVVYGIEAIQPDKADYSRGKLGIKGCEGEPVTFRITGDGVPLTKEELKDVSLKVEGAELDNSSVEGFLNRFGFVEAEPGLKLNDDGTFVLYPKTSLLPAFFLKAGSYAVTVALTTDPSVQAMGAYMVYAQPSDWFDLISLLLFLLLLAYLIYIFFIKAKFDGQTLYIDVYASAGNLGEGKKLAAQCEEVVLKKYGNGLFLLNSACSRSVGGIRVIADGQGGAYIKKRTVLSYDAWGNSMTNPVYNFDSIVSGLKKVKGREEDIPEMISLGSQAFYLKQRNRLYRITMQ